MPHRDPGRSPNGRWVSYTSDVTGRREVSVLELDTAGDPVQVSINGGSNPLWSRSGDELFFWRAEELLTVRVVSSDPLQFAAPEPLFAGRYYVHGPLAWDVSGSGEFLLVYAGPNWLREILVVEN